MTNRFPGVWKLERWDYTDATGHVSLPWDGRARGEFRFDENGGVAVQMMRDGRPLESPIGGPSWAASLTADERSQVLDGYVAYWGRYTIDHSAKTLHIDAEGSIRPGWAGGKQQRTFEFSDDARVLTLLYIVPEGTHRLVWTRV
ncbi:MAG: lipocalin-like domain-containing protein [Bryobacteraceae bacterium]